MFENNIMANDELFNFEIINKLFSFLKYTTLNKSLVQSVIISRMFIVARLLSSTRILFFHTYVQELKCSDPSARISTKVLKRK